MVHIFVKCSYTLTINYQHLHVFPAILLFDGFWPNPKTFSAWIDRWADSKALISLVQDNTVQQERFTGSVLSSNRDYTHFIFDAAQELFGLLAYLITFLLVIVIYEIQSLSLRFFNRLLRYIWLGLLKFLHFLRI